MDTLKDQLKLGGPGHDGYAYRADVYCIDCGRAIIDSLDLSRPHLINTDDSENVPQPIFFGESDCAQHCGKCGEYLYGPRKHYHYGAGLHGYLYQDGPHYAATYQDAVNGLAETYGLGRTRKANLKKHGYLELNFHRDGNEYCEISECSDNCDESDYE